MADLWLAWRHGGSADRLAHTVMPLGTVSKSSKSSYCKSSQNLKATILGFRVFTMLWNLACGSAAVLQSHMPNFKVVQVLIYNLGILKFCDEFLTFLKRAPGQSMAGEPRAKGILPHFGAGKTGSHMGQRTSSGILAYSTWCELESH